LLRNITTFFHRKRKAIEEEIDLKSKIDKNLPILIREEILKRADVEYKLFYTINRGVIKIETDNKLVAQEIAIRIRWLEERLRNSGINFKKLLI